MELGKRIKAARLEQGLSQRQLCGEVITRNMLSQIENGSARPSMDTLSHFARQLGKPMGYFLEEDAVTSPNQTVMEQARQACADGNWDGVRDLLTRYREPDGTFDWERSYLQALACMKLADQALQGNRIPYARSLLEEAASAGEKTPYYTREMEASRRLMLARAGEEPVLPDVDELLILKARQALDGAEAVRAGAYLDACEQKTALWQLLRGQVFLAAHDYQRAAACLHQAEEAYPEQTAPLLERCYSALEDYKMAYFYACKQKK